MSDDQIRTSWGMLATYRENARMLLQQAARHGGEVQAPLVTRHDLAEARGQIARYKALLRGLGAPVDDQPEDEAPPAPALPLADPARDAAARAFEERYTRMLCDRLDRPEIFGLPAMDAVSKRLRLSVAYVTLQAECPGTRRGPHEPPAPYELARRLDDWRWGEEPRRDHVGDVDQILGPIQRALITGPAGAGKSDLALRALSEGFRLVADDRVSLWVSQGRLFGRAPDTLAGLIEVRGLDVVRSSAVPFSEIGLVVEAGIPERIPDPAFADILGLRLPKLSLRLGEPSAPAKLSRALSYFDGAVGKRI